MDINDLIAKWHTKRVDDDEKFRRCFPESDDLLAIVLRGHLLIEEYIDRLNRHCFHYPEYYDQARFSFKNKLLLAKAQLLLPHPDPAEFFSTIEKINELRNELAHNLESSKLEGKVLTFLAVAEGMYPKDSHIEEQMRQECTIEKRARRAISFILGQLNALDNVIEFMEKSRVYGGKNIE